MTPFEVMGIGLLGGVGAVARFVVDGGIGGRLGRSFPYGTFVVNLLGSFVLGFLAGVALPAKTSQILTSAPTDCSRSLRICLSSRWRLTRGLGSKPCSRRSAGCALTVS
jgi:hypothetical protein